MEEQPLSLDLRTEKKRRRTRVGTACVAFGAGLSALGAFAFIRGGAEILGIWGLGFGAGLLVVGVVTLRKAATSRW
ncbi:MAG TPA: hypothetical protein VGJ84_10220 [Polyangiaceae bacterium]|jgi:hypothetical protein